MARPRRGVINLVDYLIDIYGTFSVETLFKSLAIGQSDKEIADGFGVTARTVCRWRNQLGRTDFAPRQEVRARLTDYGIALPDGDENPGAQAVG